MRYRPVPGEGLQSLGRLAKAMMGSAGHGGVQELFRKSLLRDPGAAVPEAIALTAMLDNMKPDEGRLGEAAPAGRSKAAIPRRPHIIVVDLSHLSQKERIAALKPDYFLGFVNMNSIS